MQALPKLPVADEARLSDPVLRENFIERIFVYQRWQELLKKEAPRVDSSNFHTQHKLALLSRGQPVYERLGGLVATISKDTAPAVAERFITELLKVPRKTATRRGHVNVLQHIQGYLKQKLDRSDKQELTHSIEQYRLGYVPLIVPITLLRHHFRRNPNKHMARQTYLNPHPTELMLRNSL